MKKPGKQLTGSIICQFSNATTVILQLQSYSMFGIGKLQLNSFRLLAKKVLSFSSFAGGSKIGNIYANWLVKYPVRTKAITSGLISASADIICQCYFSEKDKQFDFHRFFKFSFLGFAVIGPVLHYWYGFLAVIRFPHAIASRNTLRTICRLVLDQCVFTPIFLANFMSSIIVLDQLTKPTGEISTLELIKQKLSTDYFSTLQMNYFLWIPAMFLNFAFIPPMYQTLFSNCVGLIWNTYLSYSSFKQIAK